MARFRDLMNKGRRQLHDRMKVAAVYFMEPYSPSASAVLDVEVRIFNNFFQSGDLKGTNFNYAEILDDSPRILFMLDDIVPTSGAIISVEPGEAYRLGPVDAPDGISVIVRSTRLSKQETAGFPLPGVKRVYSPIVYPGFGVSGDIDNE